MEKYKLLILDTFPNWREMFEDCLSEKYELLMAENVNNAKSLIKQNEISLVLIGLFSSQTTPQEEDWMGIEFLEFLKTEHSNLPRIVIDSDIKGDFRKDELLAAIDDAIKHRPAKQTPKSQICQGDVIDFLIITATTKEFDAVYSKFSNVHRCDNDSYQCFVKVPTKYKGKNIVYCVVIACLMQMGPPKAAVKTLKWVRQWKPHNILLVGIAGGVKNEVNLGDVVVPEMIIDASVGNSGKKPSEFEWEECWSSVLKKERAIEECPFNSSCGKKPSVSDWIHYFPTENLLDKSRQLTWEKVKTHIKQENPERGKTEHRFYNDGIVISSCDKIEHENLIKKYLDELPKLSKDYYSSISLHDIHHFEMRGFEMEACGVTTALEDIEKEEDIEHRPGFLMIRGISDFGGENKKDEQDKYERYARDIAASYTVAFLESAPICSRRLTEKLQNKVDFLIITALKEEFSAVLSKFDNSIQIDSTQSFIEVPTKDGTVYNVIVVCLSFLTRKIEPAKTAIKTFSWVERWKPQNVLLVGIASGVRDRVDIGDIIIPENIINATKEFSTSSWDKYDVSDNLLDESNISSWNEYIKDQQLKVDSNLHRGGFMVSFGKRINDQETINYFKTVWKKNWWGFEMEGSAIAGALEEPKIKPNFMIIRAISDFGDEDKNSDQKKYGQRASDVAASYTRAFLESGPVPPIKKNK